MRQSKASTEPEQEDRGHFRTFIVRGDDSRVLRCLDCGLDLDSLTGTIGRTLPDNSGKS
jgi:hypothetical protein